MKYSEPVVVQFQSDISLRNSSCAKFSCGGVFTPYQCSGSDGSVFVLERHSRF